MQHHGNNRSEFSLKLRVQQVEGYFNKKQIQKYFTSESILFGVNALNIFQHFHESQMLNET